jgi:hypothetical protein
MNRLDEHCCASVMTAVSKSIIMQRNELCGVVALGRKNFIFAGSDGGGESAAAIYSLSVQQN